MTRSPTKAIGRKRSARAVARRSAVRLTLLGVGAMKSPRYAPAGLLIECAGRRVMLDGGQAAMPEGRLDAWLVTDEDAELFREIRKCAAASGLVPRVASYVEGGLRIRPRRVVHTSHPTYGYLCTAGGKTIVWAPEFFRFPAWAAGADLMFAEGASFRRPIHFAGGVGGHAAALAVARAARARHVRRLVFSHIGRPSIRAIDRGESPPFGEWGADGAVYVLAAAAPSRSRRTLHASGHR